MKWACLTLLVIDLLLVAAAGLRLMTVPAEKVDEFEDRVAAAVQDFSEAAQEEAERRESYFDERYDTGGEPSEDRNLNLDADAEYDEDGGNYLSDDEYKRQELDEESLAEYDDQATKGKRLNEAKDLIGVRFGSK